MPAAPLCRYLRRVFGAGECQRCGQAFATHVEANTTLAPLNARTPLQTPIPVGNGWPTLTIWNVHRRSLGTQYRRTLPAATSQSIGMVHAASNGSHDAFTTVTDVVLVCPARDAFLFILWRVGMAHEDVLMRPLSNVLLSLDGRFDRRFGIGRLGVQTLEPCGDGLRPGLDVIEEGLILRGDGAGAVLQLGDGGLQ